MLLVFMMHIAQPISEFIIIVKLSIKNLVQCISSTTYSLSRNTTGINSLSCVAECNCNTSQYEPVCGADGITYASPCNAGCTARNLTDPDVSESSL